MDSKTKKIIENTFKANLSVDSDLPIKISIYGEDVERYPNKSAWVLLDPLKLKKVEADFAFKIFELYTRTKDESVFPSYPKSSVRMKDEDGNTVYVKLDAKLYNEYAKRLLQAKTSLLKSVTDSRGWDAWSDDDKIFELTEIHKNYMRTGQLGSIIKEEFMADYDKELEKLRIQQKEENKD